MTSSFLSLILAHSNVVFCFPKRSLSHLREKQKTTLDPMLLQCQEKKKFQILLRDLCGGIKDPERVGKKGRPTIPVGDALFAVIFKVFSTVSGRRFMSDLTT